MTKNQRYKVSPSYKLIMCKKPEEGMRKETESPGVDGFTTPTAKELIVAYLEKNEQAASCSLERK